MSDDPVIEILWSGVMRPVQDLNLRELCAVLSGSGNRPLPVLLAVAKRTRALMAETNTTVSGRVLHMLNRVDPPRCACGGPGLYIVGKVTFCRNCVQKAKVARMRAMNATDAARVARDRDFIASDKRELARAAFRRCKRGRR